MKLLLKQFNYKYFPNPLTNLIHFIQHYLEIIIVTDRCTNDKSSEVFTESQVLLTN